MMSYRNGSKTKNYNCLKLETTLFQAKNLYKANDFYIFFQIQDSSSTTDQSSDLSNELPECVQLYIDTVQNSSNPDDALHIDVDQFIEELDMDSS